MMSGHSNRGRDPGHRDDLEIHLRANRDPGPNHDYVDCRLYHRSHSHRHSAGSYRRPWRQSTHLDLLAVVRTKNQRCGDFQVDLGAQAKELVVGREDA